MKIIKHTKYIFCLFLLISVSLLVISLQPAQAGPKSFLDNFFNVKKPNKTWQPTQNIEPPLIENPKQKSRRELKKTKAPVHSNSTKSSNQEIQEPRSKRAVGAAAPKARAKVEKEANAHRVLVVGDFMGAALAEGLAQSYSDNNSVLIIDKTNGSSGFVRNDYYNWSNQILYLIASEKPDAILVMIGANDNQRFADISDDTIGNEAWAKKYQERINLFAEKLKESKKPWLWISSPPFKQANLTRTIVALNAHYKEASEDYRGQFIDVWEGFVDDKDRFTYSGVDENGNIARLRLDDGIFFTKAGKKKLAFYAEKPLDKLFNLSEKAIINSQKLSADKVVFSPDSRRIEPMGLWDMAKKNQGLIEARSIDTEQDYLLGSNPQQGRADYFKVEPVEK